jgi:hypothetical protein
MKVSNSPRHQLQHLGYIAVKQILQKELVRSIAHGELCFQLL